ncbi:MAG: DMT family transporter [Solirubrobacteraceae bacterium]
MLIAVRHPRAHHGFVHHALDRVAHFYHTAYVPLTVVLLCLLGALCYAASSVLEQREAAAAPQGTEMRVGLLTHLLRQPLWLLGNLVGIAGFGFQFLALRRGSLALVQPLFVSGLMFALIGGAFLQQRRLTAREWGSSAMVAGGLALFLILAKPGPGRPTTSTAGWVGLLLATLVAVGGLWLLSHRKPRARPLFLGIAAGIALGVTAAFTERTSHRFAHGGLISALSDFSPYALVGVGAVGVLLSQSAFQAGELRWSLPALTVVEPLVAILIGQLLFSEHITLDGLAPIGEFLSLALMGAGVFGLSQGMRKRSVSG